MSRTTIIILILLALGVFIYVINRQKEAGSNKTQDELLDEMSRYELLGLAATVKPDGVEDAGLLSLNDEDLKEFIRRNTK